MTKICVVNHDFATSVIIKITILITNLSLLTKAIKKGDRIMISNYVKIRHLTMFKSERF